MSERHITITAANLHESDPTGIDLETPIGSARDIVIHAPAVRGVYLPLRITYHESDRSPTARSATFVVETKAHPTVFEFTLPDWVRRVTIFIPPIPRGAQVLEAPSWVAPGRAEVDGTAASDPELARRITTVDVSGLTFGSDDEPQEMGLVKDIRARIARETRFGDVCGDVIPEQKSVTTTRGEIDINPNDSAVFVMDPDGGGGRLVSIDESSIALDESVADKELVTELEASSVSHAIDDIIRTRGRLSKSGWRALAEERGKELDRVAGVLGRSRTRNAALRHRATDLGDAARALHDRLGERSEAMHAAQRDAAMLERRCAELTNRNEWQAGQITGQADSIAKLRERNERQGETIVKQAQERDDARALNTANARRIEEMTSQIRELEAQSDRDHEAYTAALEEQRVSKHQEQEARQTAEQNVREATDALEQMQEQRDEARAERDHAQVAEAERLEDLDVVRRDLAQARDAIDTLGSRPAITNDVAEALNGILRRVDHEGGTDGVSLVEALRLAAQQWDGLRKDRDEWHRSSREAHDLAVSHSNDLDDVNDELRNVKKALTMSDQTITERDATIERMRERHERDGRLNAAMRSELGQLRAAPFTQVGGHYGIDYARSGQARLGAWPTAPECQRVEIPANARSVQIGRAHVGLDVAALLANVAPEFVLSTAGVNRKTFARTVQHLREARQEIRAMRNAMNAADHYVKTTFKPWRR